MRRRDWLEEKRREIEEMEEVEVQRLVPSRRDFLQFTATQKRGVALIARLKRRDPLTGGAWPDADLTRIARVADEAEVGAIAICTAGAFGGRPEDLASCSSTVTAPVLCDDFCIDARQIYAARLRGADAVVVPAAGQSGEAVSQLVDVAASLHMATVIEARDEIGLAVALASPHAALGLNCAAEDGFVCLSATRALAALAPARRLAIVLAEPRCLDDLVSLRGTIDAAVVGDLLLDAADADALLTTWVARLM